MMFKDIFLLKRLVVNQFVIYVVIIAKQITQKLQISFIYYVFLIQTQNEENLFQSIEDLMVGCGYRNVFYDYLRELLQQHQVNIPYQFQIKVLKMFTEMDNKKTCTKLIMSIQNIQRYDSKGLIDFCLEKDLIEPMIYICSQITDFLTSYLRINTLLSILQNKNVLTDKENKSITTLNYWSKSIQYLIILYRWTILSYVQRFIRIFICF
ncbi:unnamed protein product [Paramecium pentaurelia]|uniref:Uncharacterized protein n=1 Tax=Paramecium pentaurelia TaxID=43138 RepID=A0A8S1Y0P0_9CILI|nr:unnamed protein product [Paramecium pentaurelia]